MYNRYSKYYPIIPLSALLLYFIYKAAGAPFSDYAGYYFGSQALLQGHYQNVYDTYSLNALIAQKGYTGVFVSYTPFPPITSLVFAPFLLFPPEISKILFNTFCALLFVITVVRAYRSFAIPRWLVWLIPVLFYIPLRNNIFFGQAYGLLFVLMLEGYMAYKKGKWAPAALLWATAIVFKLFPLIILFYLIARRQYKLVMYCLGACLVLGSVSLLINGFEAWQYYVFTLLPRANNGELNDSYGYLFQSAFMLMKNLLVYDAVQNPQVFYNSMPVFVIFMALFKALILAGCVGAKKASDGLVFTCWITAGMLLSSNGSSYSLILLLMPLMALAAQKTEGENQTRKYIYVSLPIIFLICNMPVQWFSGLPLLLKFPRLYLLLLFFVLMLTMAKARLPYKLLIAFFVLLLVPDTGKLFATTDKSRYLLTEYLPLIYDYAIKENQVVYYYWDDAGSHETKTGYGVQQYSNNDVRIQHNQVYYKNKQLTETPDLKKQVILINDKEIVYLSDKNRGVGFYALRVISL